MKPSALLDELGKLATILEGKASESASHYASVVREAAAKLATKEKRGAFLPPTLAEVVAEMKAHGLPADEAEGFMSHYSANGWRVGRNRMVSWPAAVVNWKLRYYDKHPEKRPRPAVNGTALPEALSASDPAGWREWLRSKGEPYKAHRFAPQFLTAEFKITTP